jgi:hypothetical protein
VCYREVGDLPCSSSALDLSESRCFDPAVVIGIVKTNKLCVKGQFLAASNACRVGVPRMPRLLTAYTQEALCIDEQADIAVTRSVMSCAGSGVVEERVGSTA